jgi:hypothetical protein
MGLTKPLSILQWNVPNKKVAAAGKEAKSMTLLARKDYNRNAVERDNDL